MEIALIVGFCLVLVLALAGGVLAFSNYIYSKNRIFSKTKYQVLWITIAGFMFIFMLIAGILFAVNKPTKYSCAYIGLSFTNFSISAIYLVYFLVLPKLTNGNKISYDKILNVDYDQKVKEILNKIGDLESHKNNLLTKHSKYYQEMLSFYESILNRAKNKEISLVEKMADIVTFNDAFTHKWCTKTNYYQTYLTFKFCNILKSFS